MDILGIGNALVDIFCFSDEEIALPMGLHPNSAAHVPPERMEELLLALPNQIPISGGGAANALKAAALSGASCAFIGCTGTDEGESDRWATIFSRDLAAFGIDARLERRAVPTGRCLVIRMPGGLKSIACSPSAAVSIKPEQLDPELFAQARLVHLDGQLLRNAELTDRVINLCSSLKIPLSLDIASTEIARTRAGTVTTMIERTELILFMNEDEARVFAATVDPRAREEALFSGLTSGNRARIVRKRGAAGAQAWMDGIKTDAPGVPVDHPLDDTAAGDCFAGAFLSGMLSGEPIDRLLEASNALAAATLSVPGSGLEPPNARGYR